MSTKNAVPNLEFIVEALVYSKMIEITRLSVCLSHINMTKTQINICHIDNPLGYLQRRLCKCHCVSLQFYHP